MPLIDIDGESRAARGVRRSAKDRPYVSTSPVVLPDATESARPCGAAR